MSANWLITCDIECLKNKKEANQVIKILSQYYDAGAITSDKLDKSKEFYVHVSTEINSGYDISDTLNEIAKEIWDKLDKFVPINFNTACLENLPWESKEFTLEDYEDLSSEDDNFFY